MKRIIDGKRYDTKTATLIYAYESPYPRSDFNWYVETLHRTSKGNYFLAGEGGPLSKYAERSGNETRGGSDLKPISDKDAQRWLEKRGASDELEALFGEEIEDA